MGRIYNFITFPFSSFFFYILFFLFHWKKKSIILYLDERPGKTVEALNSMPQQVVVLNGVCFFICFSNHAYCLFIYCRGQQHVSSLVQANQVENVYTILNMKTEKYGEKNVPKVDMATCGCFCYILHLLCNSMCKQIAVFTIAKYLCFACRLCSTI